MHYRADIDGLRAIAILSVLLYHINEHWLTGGFVGVDIFFVISGYLITNLLVKEFKTSGDISFKSFYLRRLRRLFPAMLFTFIFCIIGSYLLLGPSFLLEFARSLIAAVLSISNVFFWSVSGYFDTQSQYKPLLHTWSLSIEEQFYLVWPALILLLYRAFSRNVIICIVVILGALSLVLNIYFIDHADTVSQWFGYDESTPVQDFRSTIFYLLPFRVFEFVIGGVLIWLPAISNRVKLLNSVLFFVGLALIVYSITQFTNQIIFPYMYALIPCSGAALMIYSGENNHLRSLTANRLMVTLGLISYSLYLIHWPIIVFFKNWVMFDLSIAGDALILTASLVVAGVMYRYVEQPFRKQKKYNVTGVNASSIKKHENTNVRFVICSIFFVLVIISIAFNILSSNGWLWRYPAGLASKVSLGHEDYKKGFWFNIEKYQTGFRDNGKTKVLIVGDSMAADLINILVSGGYEDQFDMASLKIEAKCRGIVPTDQSDYDEIIPKEAQEMCRKEHQKLLYSPLVQQADAMILASYWWGWPTFKPVKDTVDYLKKEGVANVFVQGLKVHLVDGVAFYSKRAYVQNAHKLRVRMHPRASQINNKLKALDADYKYFDLLELLCDDHGCQRITEEGDLIIFDGTHLTPKGVKFLGEKLNQADWFNQLLNISQVGQVQNSINHQVIIN